MPPSCKTASKFRKGILSIVEYVFIIHLAKPKNKH